MTRILRAFSGGSSAAAPEAAPNHASESTTQPGGSIASALIPLGVLLVSFFIFFLALGSPRPVLPLGRDKLVAAFGTGGDGDQLEVIRTGARCGNRHLERRLRRRRGFGQEFLRARRAARMNPVEALRYE